MTHRGPFQPLPFSDSVTRCHNPSTAPTARASPPSSRYADLQHVPLARKPLCHSSWAGEDPSTEKHLPAPDSQGRQDPPQAFLLPGRVTPSALTLEFLNITFEFQPLLFMSV